MTIKQISLRTWAEVVAILLAVVVLWYSQLPGNPGVDTFSEAPRSPEIKNLAKEPVKVASVQALPAKAKEKLDVPDRIKENPKAAVLDSARLPESDRPLTVTEILNIETGATEMLWKVEPYPWIAARNKGRFRIDVEYSPFGPPNVQGSYSHELLQTKAIHWGLSGRIGTISKFGVGVYGEIVF